MPSITLHKICLIGPSEAVKQVRVKLTPPRAVEGKIPPVRDRVKMDVEIMLVTLSILADTDTSGGKHG